MKLITRDTDYALRALCYIGSKDGELVTAQDLVKALKMPRPFLRKILQELQKGGILRSYKGKAGGFELALPPAKVALTDVMRIFQGTLQLNECVFKKRLCPNRRACMLRDTVSKIEGQVARELNAVTLEHLCKGIRGKNGKA